MSHGFCLAEASAKADHAGDLPDDLSGKASATPEA